MNIKNRAHSLYQIAEEVDAPTGQIDAIQNDFENLMIRIMDIVGDDPQLQHHAQHVLAKFAHTLSLCSTLRLALVGYAAYHIGGKTPQPVATFLEHLTEAKTTSISNPQAVDKAYYPPQTGWRARLMPNRYDKDGERDRTVGFIHANNWPTPTSTEETPLISGQHDQWFKAAKDDLTRLGLGSRRRNRGFLAAHVEVKVAAMMILTDRRHVEISINHVPCQDNIQPWGTDPGCATILPQYLPAGYTLTVYGTSANGKPYSQTFVGTRVKENRQR